MGWFEEQIRQRRRADDDAFFESFSQIAKAVSGRSIYDALNDNLEVTTDAIDRVLRFYNTKAGQVPEELSDVNEILEYILRPHGIMRRSVRLEKGWYRDASGAMLAKKADDGSVVALIPSGIASYSYYDRKLGKNVRIGRANQDIIEKDAIAFYKPFPLDKMSIGSLFGYIWQQMMPGDIALLCASMLAATLVGMIVPEINRMLFSSVVSSGSYVILAGAGLYLFCASLSGLLFDVVKALANSRINTKLDINVEAAAMMRLLSLPADFFKDYSSGDLANRLEYINDMANQFAGMVFSTALSSVFSLMYIFQVFKYAPGLVVPALAVTLSTLVVTALAVLARIKITKRQMELASKENGISYALISGISKIRLAGAEKRAFSRWGKAYAEQAALMYNPPAFVKVSQVIITGISLIGTVVMYFFAVTTHVSVADYFAFNSAYGMVNAAFLALSQIVTSIADIKPALEMVRPFFDTVPEIAEDKEVITRLSGGIEIDNVTFRYKEDMPDVLSDLSLKISPGQYVAIVGKTGCGKSTLMRIMLGFEMPQKGAVYYDGKDLKTIDLKSLRQKIGSVMQNGKLCSGDIYSNIVLAAPWLTLDDAWDAAEIAGIADDIKDMPMGMNTYITEGSGGVSGGQKQRLLIARAVAPKPKILIFDEATSALDNITQKQVSEALDAMKCTRIVIAHRLSTIRHCDRIIVLDDGKIIEDGTYEQLIARKGFFAELVERQQLETNS